MADGSRALVLGLTTWWRQLSFDFVSFFFFFFFWGGVDFPWYIFVLINIFVFVSIDIFVADSIEAGRLGRKRGGSPRPNPPSHPHKTNLKKTN